MPWQEVSIVSQRREFVVLAAAERANVSEWCRRFGVSRKTAYKWLERFRDEGATALANRSRRPHRSPRRCADAIETAVLTERAAHPAWGSRKLRARLQQRGIAAPSASTITAILRRHGRIDPAVSAQHRPFQRFEHDEPNALWQMDFKGHFAVRDGRCHPLTVLDDHSRYAIGLRACRDERTETVQAQLTRLFERYGLPRRMLMDNGPPFGAAGSEYTPLAVWLIRLGVRVTHGRPYHPQTQGKDERFHRTLNVEVLQRNRPDRMEDCQPCFDRWRDVYNLERPHEALGMAVPASRFQPSPRTMPRVLPAIEYSPGDEVRRVQSGGELHFHGRVVQVSKAFRGYPLAVRPTVAAGVWDVMFCQQALGRFDERNPDGRLETRMSASNTDRTGFSQA